MKKRGVLLLLIIFLSVSAISIVSASSSPSLDSEMKKLTNYAQEYETGNIDYVQLLLHIASVRQNLNEILGATEKEMGGVLKQEQLKPVLGEPTEWTKWVWVESEEREKKLGKEVPAWQKIVFDGKKMQIKLNSWPSLFKKKQLKESKDGEKINVEETETGEKLIYRLNFEIIFKKPEEQLNIEGKIKDIQVLAQNFNSAPTNENAEALAKESVNAERTFESFFRQKQDKCEDVMKSIFGAENQRAIQKTFVQEFSFYSGENFEIITRIEMCDDCEWNSINLDFRFEGRGKFKVPEAKGETFSQESFKDINPEDFEDEIRKAIEELKQETESGNYDGFYGITNKVRALNEAWNQKSNDLWKEVDKIFESKRNSLSQEEMQKFNENYGWLKEDQERRAMVRVLQKANYEKRKQFYSELFNGYEKKEYYFEQAEFEKRLIEEFKEFGEEICDNNQDDNGNGEIDCSESQCGGKICGWIESTAESHVSENQNIENNSNQESEPSSDDSLNETLSIPPDINASSFLTGNVVAEETTSETSVAVEKTSKKIPMYCINKACQLKEELVEEKTAVCRNHICEENETETCAEDCAQCPAFPPLECAGKVIFKGKDKNNCPLEPICLEENRSCSVNEDCAQPLCGKAECLEGECKVTSLEECREAECVDGDEKIMNCESGEKIVVEKCIDGVLVKTNIECAVEAPLPPKGIAVPPSIPEEIEEPIAGSECTAREECGGENDVCSNGKCVAIPQKEEVVEEIMGQGEEPRETEEVEGPEESEEAKDSSSSTESTEPATTGAVVFAFFKTLLRNTGIVGEVITGFQTEGSEAGDSSTDDSSDEPTEETDSSDSSSEQTETPSQEQNNEQTGDQSREGTDEQEQQGNEHDEDTEREENEQEERERREEEQKRMEEENRERCKKECVRPCVEKCTREKCGEKMDCNVDEIIKLCEQECKPDDSCVEKCMKGGDWWKEYENKEANKQEKGVFQVGGTCRKSQSKTEGFIWFGGWGDPFQKIQDLKQKYYSGGDADWCKQDLENLKKRRKAFEQGFDQEFVAWFFEKYLANSAEDWEQQTSGIFEIYWNNVDTIREMTFRLECLDEELDEKEFNLINVNYSTEYGSLEFWEEIKTAKMPGLDKEVKVITPYMKVWIFPPKSFIIYEMKDAMKKHEFPGKPEDKAERKNEEGPTAAEKEMIKQDEKFMEKIKKISEQYEGNLDAVIQFKDYETNEIVFNLYVQVNENDILKMEPMLPEEVPAEDVKAEVDFEKIYELIYFSEKDMQGAYTETPPWDKKSNPVGKIKDAVNGIKMYFKVRSIMNSAEVYPKEAKRDIKSLAKTFFSMMQKSEQETPKEGEMQEEGEAENIKEDVLGSKEEITGEVIRE